MSENSIALYFSETISLSALEVATGETLLYAEAELEINDIPLSEGDAIPELAEVGEKRTESYGKEICFAGDNKTKPGEYYVLSGTATDQHGNSLKFRIPFYGFNSRKAGLVISEVRTAKNGDKELEFIELYVYRPGNLAGISVSTAIDSKNGFEERNEFNTSVSKFESLISIAFDMSSPFIIYSHILTQKKFLCYYLNSI